MSNRVRRAATLVCNAIVIVMAFFLLLQLRSLWMRAIDADNAMSATVYTMGDDHEYEILAVNLVEGRGFAEAATHSLDEYHLDLTSPAGSVISATYAKSGSFSPAAAFYRAPGLPLLLAGAYAIFGVRTVVARLLLATLTWMTAVLLLLIGRSLHPTMGAIAGSLAAIFFLQSPMIDLKRILTEIPTAFWITLFALLYIWYIRRGTNWLLVGAALAFAAAVYTRSLYLVALPLLLVYELGRRSGVGPIVVFASAVLIPVAVWSVYASLSAGKFVAFTTQGEIAFPQFNNIDALEGVGPNHEFQGIWNPGYLQDAQGHWYTDYHNAAQPGENGWVKGLSFWKDHFPQLPRLFFLKLQAGFWYDNGGNMQASIYLGCIGALLMAIGFRRRESPRKWQSRLTPRAALLVQYGLLLIIFTGLLPFIAVLLIGWPLMILIGLLWPYGDIAGLSFPNPVWLLAFVAGHFVVTAIFGGEPRFHQPLDALLFLFGLLITLSVVSYVADQVSARKVLAIA